MRKCARYQTARQVITAKRNHATRRAKERHGLDLSREIERQAHRLPGWVQS